MSTPSRPGDNFEEDFADPPPKQDPYDSPLVKKALILFGLLVAVIGPFIIRYAIGVYQEHKAAQSWPTVQGRITESRVQTEGTVSVSHRAIVKYKYEVDGKKYVGDRITAIESTTKEKSRARNKINLYPKGAQKTVHYSPDDPSVSLLSVQTPMFTYFLFAIGVVIIPIGLAPLLLSLRGRSESQLT